MMMPAPVHWNVLGNEDELRELRILLLIIQFLNISVYAIGWWCKFAFDTNGYAMVQVVFPCGEPYCSPRMNIENNLIHTRSCAALTYNFELLFQENFGIFKLPTSHRCIFLYPCAVERLGFCLPRNITAHHG